MARRDRLRQGQEAKERVMARLSGGGSSATSNTSSTRRDRLKPVTSGIDHEVRALAPDAFNPFKQQEAIRSTLAPKQTTPAPVTIPDTMPKASELLKSDYTRFATPSQPTRKEYIADRIQKDRESVEGKPVLSTIQRLTEPVMSAIYGFETLPGVADFQRGANSALNISGGNPAPFEAPAIIAKPAEIAGMLAGSVTNPAAIEQNLVTAPYRAAQSFTTSKTGQALTRQNRLAQRAVEGATAGAIQGGAISGVRGETDADELAKNIGIGAALGGAGDIAISTIGRGVGALSRRSRMKNTTDVAQDTTPQQMTESVDSPQVRTTSQADEVENIRPQSSPDELDTDQLIREINTPRKRDRVYSWLDNQEQAARQRMSKRRGSLNSNPLPEWGDMTIIGAAKLGKGTIKAADWTEEMVKEFGESFRPVAQRVYNASKEELRRQEKIASKEGQAADAFNSTGTGDASSFRQKVSRGTKRKSDPWSKRVERFRSQFEDDVIALQGLEKRVTGRIASAEDSLYKSARMYKGTPERAAQYVTQRLSPIAKTIESQGKTMDDLGDYALAVHARDVNNAGMKSGFTNAEIDDVIRTLGTPEMEQARLALIQINKDLLKEQVSAGNVGADLAEVLDNRWQNYIPLFRDMGEGSEGFGGGLSQALANVSSPIKTLKGSERNVIDPMENMIKNIFQSVNSIERNKVAGQLSKLAKIDAEQKFIRKLDPDEKVGTKNVVTVREGGQPVKYEVEPEVYKAMLNLDQESSNMLINILSKPASLLRAGATLTPEFSLRNPMRDINQAFITSKSGFNPITDFGAGLIQSITKGPLYQQWIDNLGSYGNIMSMDRDLHRQALQKVLKEPVSKKFVNVLTGRSLMRVLRAITDTTESATKVGEFRAALRQGQTPQEAAYRSRDLMDFARAGSSVRQTNKIVAFLNANIQGKSKLLRSVKENPVGTISRAFASVTAPTVGIYFANQALANDTQKQTIKEAPDWMRDSFWLLAVPGTDVVARIPKPFDLAPIFANLPERALQFTQENDPEAFDGFLRRSISSSALPTQITGLTPFIEGMSNYSFFRQGDIIPQREQGLEFKDQYDPIRTTEAAKLIAGGVDKLTGGQGPFKNFGSPRIVDNTIQGLTAGLGSYGTSAIDSILQGMVPFTKWKVGPSLIDRPTAPEKRLEQQPLVKAFTVDPLQGGVSMDKFYKEKEQLQKQKASANINDKVFPIDLDKRLKSITKTSDKISEINKEIRTIEQSSLTAKEKRAQIESLTKERNRLAREAVGR